MRVTQRLFVELLTKLLMSDLEVNVHCPATLAKEVLIENEINKLCKVCQLVSGKYLYYGGEINDNCPCTYITNFKPEDIDTSDVIFWEDYVRFEATRIVEGWNKDHPSPERRTNGGEDV